MPPHGRRNPGAPGEKADFGALKKIVLYCRRYLPAILAALVFAVGSAVATIIGPEKIAGLMTAITSGLFSGIDLKKVEGICLSLVILYGAGALLGYGQQFITATVTQNTARRLRRDIDQKLDRLPLRYFDRSTKGDILSRVTNDVDVISQTLSSSAANLISSVTLFFGVIWKMFRANALLAGLTVASSLLGFAAMTVILRLSQKYFVRKQADLGMMNGQIEEVYTNHKIVRAFGAKGQEKAVFDQVNDRLYDSNWKSQFLSGMMPPIMGFVGNLSYVLIFVAGTLLILRGSAAVNLGTLVSFVIYARLFSQPLSTLAQSMTSLQQASAASKRVFDLLEEEELAPETVTASLPENVKGEVCFEHVRFGYTPGKTVIHDFSARLKAGQKVAIVGPTGAGKTTMVNLLMRFYEVDEGDITVDGVSIRALPRAEVRGLFDMILQDTWLFDGTIRENLVFNKENVTREELDRAVEAVGLKHFISTLQKGYDTVISDALNLSEGQKQQLTIARAMIRNSPLLILDEATSSVDTRTELVIQEAMDRLTHGKTSFVIAHRLSTIRNADVILVMRDGDIAEQGSHDELMAKGGFYTQLYNSQFANA